jgi:uncharacterized protein
MSKGYDDIAFTEDVRRIQDRYGSRTFYDRRRMRRACANGSTDDDALSDAEREHLAERDSFYLATVSQTGWPYVQFRGGPAGFLRVLDDNTVGWARSNLGLSTFSGSARAQGRHRPRGRQPTAVRTPVRDAYSFGCSFPACRGRQPLGQR